MSKCEDIEDLELQTEELGYDLELIQDELLRYEITTEDLVSKYEQALDLASKDASFDLTILKINNLLYSLGLVDKDTD